MATDADMDMDGTVILYCPFFYVDNIGEDSKRNGCRYGY